MKKTINLERKGVSKIQTTNPSQLPGLRSSFFCNDKNKLTSASLHMRSYGYSPNKTKDKISGINLDHKENKKESEKEVKIQQQSKINGMEQQKRKWVTKRDSDILTFMDSYSTTNNDILNKLKSSNKVAFEGNQRLQRTISQIPSPKQTSPLEVDSCDDCSGAITETEAEDDSGIFTSSISKYSIDDEMIENDDEKLDELKDKEEHQSTKNFGSDSDDICSRETSPLQLLADLLRKSPDTHTNDITIRTNTSDNKQSLVKLRRLQFEQNPSACKPKTRSFASLKKDQQDDTALENISKTGVKSYLLSCDKLETKNVLSENQLELAEKPDENMISSMVSNTSRLSICTDCTAASDENENKFFDDDYTDQQQLILSAQEENGYSEMIFDRVDSLLQSKKDEQEGIDHVDGIKSKITQSSLEENVYNDIIFDKVESMLQSKIDDHVDGSKHQQSPMLKRVSEIKRENSSRSRQASVATVSSLASDDCMLDFDK